MFCVSILKTNMPEENLSQELIRKKVKSVKGHASQMWQWMLVYYNYLTLEA